ncbi:tRNA-modifying protein YgfZ [Colwellia sp. RE-S-Sl-9]
MTIKIDQSLPSLEQLPSVFAITLDDLAAISLTGEEQNKYLQGQVTCDVNSANENSLLNGSHCDAKGKVFSAFRFIMRNKANLLIQPKATLAASLAELKKFGVFAKVSIEAVENLTYIAVCGQEAKTTLAQHFSTLPCESSPVETIDSTTLVYIEGQIPRYIIINEADKISALASKLNITTYAHAVWNLLEISEGFPTLNESSISAYVPQMLNLQAVNAISFTKGCYLGQETVARMQYLGKNKRALYSLKGNGDVVISADSIIEKQLGENWRKAGDLLTSYTADNGDYYLQAVLASDTDETTNLRIKDANEASLHIQPLPYTLTTQD